MDTLLSLATGFGASCSLILAIGAQNAFVIRQGLRGQHLFVTALTCSLIDAILIAFGVLGFGHTISEYPLFLDIAKYFAVIFLFAYGALTIRSIFKNQSLKWSQEQNIKSSARATAFTVAALSLLNPHVYLDTVILLGSIGSQQPAELQGYFAIGAILASFSWFFAITYGARLLAPLFQKENSWKVIDALTGITMWGIGASLFSLI